jgi:tape measure domain-containing protein
MMATSWAGGMQMIRGMGQIISGTVGVIQNSVDMLFNYGRAWAGVNNVLAGSRMMIQGVQMAYLGLFSAMRGGFTGLFTAGVFQFFTGLQSFFTGLRQSSAGIVGMWNNLTGGFQSFYQILQGGGNVIGGFIKGGLGALKDAFMSVASGVWAAVKGVGTAVWELGKAFMSVGFEVVTGMAKTLTAGLGGLLLVTGLVGAQTLRLAADYEKANIAFGVMTGNAEMGTKLLEDITQLGIQSPFRSTELIPIAKELKAFGIETDQIIPTLKALGNVSAGTDTPLSRIALAFGQVRVAGRLTGDELRQFVNANVPLIEYLAQVMNVPVTSIRNMVEAGRVGFNHVQMAFNAMSAEGGAFAGLMEKLNNTVGGQ